VACVDAYDAMASHRSYRTALAQGEVVVRLRNGGGSQFDPTVVRATLDIVSD
jgi:HD-GYP domain-containing protein (c-di-GMP phosphodiesterase class II)